MIDQSKLVFKIKVGDGFRIGDFIEVKFLERQGNWIRILVILPRDLKLSRSIT